MVNENLISLDLLIYFSLILLLVQLSKPYYRWREWGGRFVSAPFFISIV